jgi:hypothetical protein
MMMAAESYVILRYKLIIEMERTRDGLHGRAEVWAWAKFLQLGMWHWQRRTTFSGAIFPDSGPELMKK